MMKILPIIMLLMGAGAGVGAGLYLREDVSVVTETTPELQSSAVQADPEVMPLPDPETPPEYISLNNQFVVPVVGGDLVESLVVLSLGVEVTSGSSEIIYRSEPKLRDVFLQVLFDHANMGGFRGRFTDGNNMDVLRLSLTEAAQSIVGDSVKSIMITDIARQDI